MKIKGVRITVSPMHITIVVFFIVLFIFEFFITGYQSMYLFWGIPLALLLLVVPLINSYSVGKQYVKLLPEYEREAKPCRIKQIGAGTAGRPVRVEGVVQSKKGGFIGRPGYKIFDGSGAVIVQRSNPFDIEIKVGDNIQVVGMVTRRFAFIGNYVVHAIGAKIIENHSEIDVEMNKDIKIKKYN
ncbi:MAG: hypothetical protein Q4Q53_05020 [Methanocorpusculum sp.]|nr:hypothetical protein [Methanocorpusculum sp.]